MRKLLKKLFYRDAPAEGAVFASLLFWLGTWCLATAFVFADGLCVCFLSLFTMSEYVVQSLVWQHLFLAAEFLLMLYHLIVTGRFYHTLIREKWRYGIWILAAAGLAGAVVEVLLLWRFGWGGLVYLILCLLIPLVCMPKQWKWLIPAAFGPALILFPFVAVVNVVWHAFNILIDGLGMTLWHLKLLVFAPWLVWLAVLLGVLCTLCGFKAYANAAGKTFRSLFGKGTAAAGVLFLLTYGVSLVMAYSAHCRTERHIAELEKHFGRPVTAQGLKELYYRDCRPDAAFWAKVLKLKLADRPQEYIQHLRYPALELSPAELAVWRKRLDDDREQREMEKLFESELPGFEREFLQGNLAGILMPELQPIREFAFFEAWRIRFAAADRDPAAALAALHRTARGRDHLARQPFLIAMLVMIAVEDIRLDALESLLNSGVLTDSMLRAEKEDLARFRKQIGKIHFRSIYGEAAMIMDVCDLFTYGSRNRKVMFPAFYRFRWLFPAGWYVATRSRDVLAVSYKVSDFTSIVYNKRQLTTDHYLAGMFLPALDLAGKKIHRLTARYLAMETLIGIELEKRRTGKYPEKLENPPLDPFGQPLLYRHGKMPYIRYRWDSKMNMLGPGKKVMVDAVAVWSRGANRKDDHGLSNWKEDGKPTDDARAMIMKNPL